MSDKPPLKRGERRDISGDLAAHRIVEEGRRFWSNRGTSKGKVAGIPFGTPGSFDQCVTRVEPHLGAGAKGYCAERYHEAVGEWPGRHSGGRGRS